MRRFLVGIATLSLAGLTACGGSDQPSADGSSPAEVVESDPVVTTWPLTGLEAGKDTALTHPVYIAKIDNTPSSAPQVGLGEADMVFEELVEGGITRLAAFFYSDLPTQVGPVRSMRLTDIGIASPVGAKLVTSGAAPETLAGLADAGVKFHNMNNDALWRESGRSSVYSVMADLTELAKDDKGAAVRPQDYFDFGTEADWTGTQEATDVDIQISGYRTSQWTFAGGSYQLDNGYMDASDAFKADTLIMAKVKVTDAPYLDPAGSPVPVSHFEGKGQAIIFHDGQAVRATWHKEDVGDQVTFTTKAGEVLVPPGKTWVHLVPTEGGATFK